MTTKKLDKQTVKIVQADLVAAIRDVLAKHGLKPSPSSLRYDEFGFKMSFEASLVGSEAEKANRDCAFEFERWGVKFGDTVTSPDGKKTFKVTGFKRGGLMTFDAPDGSHWKNKPQQLYKDGKRLVDKWADPKGDLTKLLAPEAK